MYRLHIDVPCGTDQAEAIALAKDTIQQIQTYLANGPLQGTEIGVRLGEDSDRSKKDYLRINNNGHAANGKQKIIL